MSGSLCRKKAKTLRASSTTLEGWKENHFCRGSFFDCKFSAKTHIYAPTKMLFPLTRQGDWRRKHLFSGQERSKKRSSDSISKDGEDLDSEIGGQTAIDEGHGDTGSRGRFGHSEVRATV